MMFQPADLMTVKDAAGVVGEAPDGCVRLNGVQYQLPTNFPPDVAKEIVMIELDTKGLKSVYVPQFRLESYFGVAPKVYSQFNNVTLKAGWDSKGNALMTLNPFSLEDSRKVLTLEDRDVVEDCNTKLKSFKKPASFLGGNTLPSVAPRPKAKAKAKGKAKTKAKAKGKGKAKAKAKGKGKGKGKGKR